MGVALLEKQEIEEIARNGALMALAEVKEELNPLPVWMTLREVCAYVQLSETKVRELIKNGFPCSTIGGDKRFFRADVDRFMRGEK